MIKLDKLTLDFLNVYNKLGYKYLALDEIDHSLFLYDKAPVLNDNCWENTGNDFIEIEHVEIYEDICPKLEVDMCYVIEELLKANNYIKVYDKND